MSKECYLRTDFYSGHPCPHLDFSVLFFLHVLEPSRWTSFLQQFKGLIWLFLRFKVSSNSGWKHHCLNEVTEEVSRFRLPQLATTVRWLASSSARVQVWWSLDLLYDVVTNLCISVRMLTRSHTHYYCAPEVSTEDTVVPAQRRYLTWASSKFRDRGRSNVITQAEHCLWICILDLS